MRITLELSDDGHGQARVEGELTIYHADAMKREVASMLAQVDELRMDLSAVSEIDTAGLQVLMALKNEARTKKKQLILTHHSQAVVDLFDIGRLTGFFGDPILLHGKTEHYGEEPA